MMSGCGILTNGKGTRREYGQCNLDELAVGDRIGLIRYVNGELHFFVNSRDQGVAASNVPHPVWGVVGKPFFIKCRPKSIFIFSTYHFQICTAER